MHNFPIYTQHDAMDCGPTCLRMIAEYYGRVYSLEGLREKSHLTRQGVSLLGISETAENIGFRTMGVSISFEDLQKIILPCIVHWNQSHFVVVYKIRKIRGKIYIYVADPAAGKIKYTKEEFCRCWISSKHQNKNIGIALILEPGPEFLEYEDEKIEKKGFTFLFSYLVPYKNFLLQLLLGLIFGSLIQLILPFLSQSIVDFGIGTSNRSFIYLVLLAQFMLILGSTSVGFIRG